MTILLPPPRPSTPTQPSTTTRNKTGVINLVKSRAPAKVQCDADWWAAWLKSNW